MTHPTIEKAAEAIKATALHIRSHVFMNYTPEAKSAARVILAAEPSDDEVWKIQPIIYSSSEWARMGPFTRVRKLGLIFEALKAANAARAKEMGL